MQITINFQAVEDGLPPAALEDSDSSIKCIAVVDGDVFDDAVFFDTKFFKEHEIKTWYRVVWHPMDDDYRMYLTMNENLTHWAPWPVLVPSEVAA
jgi:hypothetical protein